MSLLDDELKDALDVPTTATRDLKARGENGQEGNARNTTDGTNAAVRAPKGMSATVKRRWGLLIGLLFMGGAILFVVLSGIDNAAVYSKSVSQLFAERSRLKTRHIRVVGHLVSGTLKRRSEPCEYRFQLTEGNQTLDVHYPQCVVPDTFRDVPGVKVEVTAEGHLQEDGAFLADHIMAKCPSKYDMKDKGNAGMSMPVVK
jgi:cytochrome c-type biogenesis protein CcmE